jgi:SET domain-containing protein
MQRLKYVQAGQFVIEYCGEVISWREAKRRSHAYESEGISRYLSYQVMKKKNEVTIEKPS